MDNQVIAEKILESYEKITIEKLILDRAIMFKLFDKDFLLFLPDVAKPESRPFVYLYNDESFDFPHVMFREEEFKNNPCFPKGKYRLVCLYENESIINSIISFEDKLSDAINRLIELLSMSDVEKEKEFQKEFMFYWNSSASITLPVSVYLRQEKRFTKMKVYCNKKETRYIEEVVNLSDIENRKKDKREWQYHIENDVFFIPITDIRGILPPHRGYSWKNDNIRDIVQGKQIDHVDCDTYQCITTEQVSTKDVILVFGMYAKQLHVTFAVKLRCKNRTGRTLIDKICEDTLSVEPIVTKRKDYLYLSKQIGNDIGVRWKKALLVGGGSLGSYVAFELVKNGVSVLTIYDEDKLVDENIMRWAYGGFLKEHPKTTIIKALLEYLHPEIHVKDVSKNIDEKTLIEEMNQVDIIIFTIGSSDLQLQFNQILHHNSCRIPVIYTWLEAGGEYSHILTVEYDKVGCYQCLFTEKGGDLINNRANINDDNNLDNSIIRNGCGGTRAAYGTAVLLRTTAVLLDTIKKLISGEIKCNTLIDITPENVTYPKDIVPMKECKCCGYKNK